MAIDVACPEQIDWLEAEAVGKGFTVATGETDGPEHPLAVGVMVYVTVPFTEVVAFNVCVILLPLPDKLPVAFEADAVQLKVVPLTPFGLVIAMDVACAEQMDWLEAEALGIGLTVTVAVIAVPTQPLAEGVIV